MRNTCASFNAFISVGGGMADMGSSTSPTQFRRGTGCGADLLREGQYLNAGQSIFTVYQASSLVAEFSLNPQDVSQLQSKGKSNYYAYSQGEMKL